MRTTRKKRVTVEEVESITCDCCGGGILTHPASSGENLEGTHIQVTGGYHSRCIGDMVTLAVDVCEKCLVEWFRTFKHPPTEEEELES